MARKPPDLLIVGEGIVATALKAILKVPVVPRRSDDSGWDWPKGGIADRSKIILVASPHSGVDRIVRHHAELWTDPEASRLGVVIVVPTASIAGALLDRDVFGRKGASDSRFACYSKAIQVIDMQITLGGILRTTAEVGYLLIDTWLREARNASCIPPLLDAIRKQSVADLEPVLPVAGNVHWDSICFPTPEFSNGHAYANAVDGWIKAVTRGVTPDWKRGLDLLTPLVKR